MLNLLYIICLHYITQLPKVILLEICDTGWAWSNFSSLELVAEFICYNFSTDDISSHLFFINESEILMQNELVLASAKQVLIVLGAQGVYSFHQMHTNRWANIC